MRDRDTIDTVIPDLIGLGVISFKMFMTWNLWEPDCKTNLLSIPDDLVMRVMDLASRHGGIAAIHAENGTSKSFLERSLRSQGKVSSQHYLDSAPNILEAKAAYRAATMALVTGSPLYLVHLSTREVVPIIEHFREGEGLSIFGETCPHYLTLTNDDLLARGYTLKVAPPLRQEEDVQAMWRGLAGGALSTIGSDFTGCTRVLKLTGSLEGEATEPERGQENIFDIAAGLSTLEFMMPVVWTHGVNAGRITLPRFVQVFSENPAKIFGMYPRKGVLQPGSDADITIWDPTRPHVVDEEHSVNDLSTFKGMDLLGMPVLTMVRGQVIVEDGNLVGSQGVAKYIPRDPDSAAYAPNGPQTL